MPLNQVEHCYFSVAYIRLCWPDPEYAANPVINDGALMMAALDVEKRYRLSYWDAMIVAAAQHAGVETLHSEDFNDGQAFGPVRVVNPFG